VLLSFQSVINIVIALFVYYFILPSQNDKGKKNCVQGYLLGYGMVIPFLLRAPFLLLELLPLKNVTLIICAVGAIPVILFLRVLEAIVRCTAFVPMLLLYAKTHILLIH
jgi:hypothetical protein